MKETTKQNYKNGFIQKHNKKRSNNTKHHSNLKQFTKSSILLDKDIGRIQYLVRFRAGVEGRKIAVHEWIFLEEHPIMVAVSLAWVNMDCFPKKKENQTVCVEENTTPNGTNSEIATTTTPNATNKSAKQTKFRPVQLFVRTALEMAAVDEINHFSQHCNLQKDEKADPALNVVGMFFSRNSQNIVIPLNHNKDDALKLQCHSITTEEKKSEIAQSSPECKESLALESSVNTPLSSNKSSQPSLSNEENTCTREEKEGEEETKCDDDNNDQISSLDQMMDLVVADFNDPPKKLESHLKETWACEEMLNISIALAAMEAEEQRRIKDQTLQS